MVTGAFSSVLVIADRSTTDGADVNVGTTEGHPSVYLAGSEKLYKPTF